MYLVKALRIDTNNGYNKEVGKEINKVLTELQTDKCEILGVDQQGVDGRNAYVMVKYNDPRFDLVKKE